MINNITHRHRFHILPLPYCLVHTSGTNGYCTSVCIPLSPLLASILMSHLHGRQVRCPRLSFDLESPQMDILLGWTCQARNASEAMKRCQKLKGLSKLAIIPSHPPSMHSGAIDGATHRFVSELRIKSSRSKGSQQA